MSLRALKPRSERLVPCQLDSPAPIEMLETLRKTSVSEVWMRSSISCRVTTLTICGVSTIGWVSLAMVGVSAL